MCVAVLCTNYIQAKLTYDFEVVGDMPSDCTLTAEWVNQQPAGLVRLGAKLKPINIKLIRKDKRPATVNRWDSTQELLKRLEVWAHASHQHCQS